MDIVKIQSLITQGKILTTSDINNREVYLQAGVFQEGNRQSGGSNANSYAPYVISIAELLAGVTPTPPTPSDSAVVFVNKVILLNTTSVQTLSFPTTGLYIVDSVLVTNASIDLSGQGIMDLTLTLPGTTGASFSTADIGPPASDLLNELYSYNNYIYMTSNTPPCFPPPCNGSFVYEGSITAPMEFTITTPAVANGKVEVYVKLLKLA